MKPIFFICFLFFTTHLFPQEKYSRSVKTAIANAHLSDKEPLYLICINANDCVNCLLPLGDILQQLNDRKITNVAYLIDGIQDSEKNKYAYTVIRLDTLKQKIFADKPFYTSLNPTPASKIMIAENGKLIYNEKIKDLPDDNRLKNILERSTKRIVLVDSLSFDASVLRGTFTSDLMNDSTLIILDSRYQEIKCVSLKDDHKVKTVNNHTIGLNVDSLLTITLSGKRDSTLLWYNKWLRHQPTNFFTKNPLFPDVDLMNLVVQDNNIMLVAGIPVFQPTFGTRDTTFMITKIPFLIRLDKNLKVRDVFSFATDSKSQPPKNYIASLFVPFYFNADNTIYFKTSFEGNKEDFKNANSIMVCKINNKNRICFDHFLNFNYPDFFWQKGLYNDYNNCNFSPAKGKPYFYFTFTPDIYDLSAEQHHRIDRTSYEQSQLNQKDGTMDIQFKMQAVFSAINGYCACYVSNKKIANLVWYDQSWNEIGADTLPRQNVLRAIARNNYLFVLSEDPKTGKAAFYKYGIN